MRDKLKAQVKKTIDQQTKYYNAKYKLQLYKVGDMVYLNNKIIKSTQQSKKLDYKYYKLYKVELSIEKQAYLPPDTSEYKDL